MTGLARSIAPAGRFGAIDFGARGPAFARRRAIALEQRTTTQISPPVAPGSDGAITSVDRMKTSAPCPCGTDLPYAACCGRFLDGVLRPETAEALMRSRYVAHVLDRADYLLRTWHPATRPATIDREGELMHWLGLKVVRVAAGGSEDARGIVEFVARYKIAGRAQRLHEISRFVWEDGQWFYWDAVKE